MNLQNDQELKNTERKRALLEEQVAKAKARPDTPANRESIRSLIQTGNQLREDIIRYQSQRQRQAS